MKNDENSVNLSRRDFFKELGMIGGGGVLLSAFPWLQSCSADDKVQIAKEKVRSQKPYGGSVFLVHVGADITT